MSVRKRWLLVAVLILQTLILCLLAWDRGERDNREEEAPPVVVTPEPEPVPPPIVKPTLEDAVQVIDRPEIEKELRYLASDELEGRMTGKAGNVLAAEFIKKRFEEFGLKTMYHRFSESDIGTRIRGVNPGPKKEMGDDFSQNIYGWVEGTDPTLKNEIVVVGAHMDHIGYGPSMSRSRQQDIHPGADDNASGTVALIQVAEAFGKLKGDVKRTVVFQAYSAEEMGLLGSRFYCNNPVFPEGSPSMKAHVAMINMDMVGYLKHGQHFAGFSDGESSISLKKIIADLDGKYTFAKSITSHGTSGSDHASFYNKKVSVAFLHTGLHPYYHTPDDTADRINYDGVEQVAKYAFELAWRVAQDEATPRFNTYNFQPMPYTHDHGHPEVKFGENDVRQ